MDEMTTRPVSKVAAAGHDLRSGLRKRVLRARGFLLARPWDCCR